MIRETPYTLRIDFPTVSANVGGNARGHWRTRASALKAAKQTGVLLVRNAIIEHELHDCIPWSPVDVTVTWLYTNARHRPDLDNLSSRIKPYLDSAVTAGLLVDDGPDHILTIRYEYQRAKRTGVRMLFTKVAGQDDERLTA